MAAPCLSISIDSSRHARATGATRAVGPKPTAVSQLVGPGAHLVHAQLAERLGLAVDVDGAGQQRLGGHRG